MMKKYLPTMPTNCPIPRGWQNYSVVIDSRQMLQVENFFWGNFYPPSGFYKFKVYTWTTQDPEAGQGEWVTEILTKKGEMSAAEW
jgi:hypothetical protein